MHFLFKIYIKIDYIKRTGEELNPYRFRVVSIFFLRKYEQIFIIEFRKTIIKTNFYNNYL